MDLDRDGDMDVLVTNGDMLDDFLLKPYHGIRWLENKGALRFEEHPLANLPASIARLPRDLDVDGDLDVVACAYVEFKASAGASSASDLNQPSLVWLEQVAPRRFERRTLERGAHHVAMDVADYDDDGDPDLLVGSFRSADAPVVELWENRGTRSPSGGESPASHSSCPGGRRLREPAR